MAISISQRYHILSPIQEGSTATVYKALDSLTNKMVALKKFNMECVDALKLRKEFRSQQALSQHPNVGKVIEYSMGPREAVAIMEYYSGGDLIDQITPDVGMEKSRVVEYMLQVVDAVRFMHNQGYVHRDLKSENICIDSNGKCQVIDFGMAQQVTQPVMVRLAGTVPYLSPEQLDPTTPTYELDLKACDVFSLGIMMWSCFTGRFPWRQASTKSSEYTRFVQNAQNVKELALWSKVPSDMQALIREMLASDVQQRLTIDQVYNRLEIIATTLPARAA